MGDHTTYLKNKILDHVYRNVSYTPPAAVYMGLFTAAPSDAGGGTEVSGGGYARQAITFGAASSGVIANTAAIDFSASGANFGTITHIGIFDASTAGNLLDWKSLSASVVVNDAETLRFPIGYLTETED